MSDSPFAPSHLFRSCERDDRQSEEVAERNLRVARLSDQVAGQSDQVAS